MNATMGENNAGLNVAMFECLLKGLSACLYDYWLPEEEEEDLAAEEEESLRLRRAELNRN